MPSCVTAPALVMVGIFMMMELKELGFGDGTDLVPACVAIFVMPLSYSLFVAKEASGNAPDMW